MKQTAVEWQFEQLFNSFEKFNNGECTFNDFLIRNLEIRKQAKEMEKGQNGYSEEDVIKLLTQRSKHFGTNVKPFQELLLKQDLEWFEQFKQQEQ
jgi:hypothetical protein